MPTWTTAGRNAQLDAIGPLYNAGKIVLKVSSTIIATLTLGASAWSAAASGQLNAVLGSINGGTVSAGGGTITSAELLTSGDVSHAVLTVGVGTGDVQLPKLAYADGEVITPTQVRLTAIATPVAA